MPTHLQYIPQIFRRIIFDRCTSCFRWFFFSGNMSLTKSYCPNLTQHVKIAKKQQKRVSIWQLTHLFSAPWLDHYFILLCSRGEINWTEWSRRENRNLIDREWFMERKEIRDLLKNCWKVFFWERNEEEEDEASKALEPPSTTNDRWNCY